LSLFFKYTGIALIIVAAGVLSYGLREFQDLGIVPGAHLIAWDVTSVIGKDSIAGALLTGTIGFDTTTTWLQFGVYAAYLVAVLTPYLSKGRQKSLISA
jgi:high-affinity iron transporter